MILYQNYGRIVHRRNSTTIFRQHCSVSACMNAPETQSLNELAATKICRKAPLPRFALKPSLLKQAEQLWEDTLEALLLSGSSAVHNPRT